MAEHLASRINRLARGVVVPLLAGGRLTVSSPVGPQCAFELGDFTDSVDREVLSYIHLARLRVARALVPLDRIDVPTRDEWALAALVHDWLFAARQDLGSLLRRSYARKLASWLSILVSRIPPPRTTREVLLRHTLLGRVLEITRTDTELSWWTGSAKFYGEPPPERLLALPDLRALRKVTIDRTLLSLLETAEPGARETLSQVVRELLQRSPLTELLAVVGQKQDVSLAPASVPWLRVQAGRRLALRALRPHSPDSVYVALGKAIDVFVRGGRVAHAVVLLNFLSEYALERAACLESAGERNAAPAEREGVRSIAAYWALRRIPEGAFARKLHGLVVGRLQKWAGPNAKSELAAWYPGEC